MKFKQITAYSAALAILCENFPVVQNFPIVKSLVSVKIPESVTTIEKIAFYGCSSLPNIVTPEGVLSIQGEYKSGLVSPNCQGAFGDCTNLSDVSLPSTLLSIGNSTFYNCTNLTNITIPEEITSIADILSICTLRENI